MEQESRLDLRDPVTEAISRMRFAPSSNNLLISSWDSGLRLYNVDESELRSQISTEEALLDCCFVKEEIALSAGSDGSIKRFDLCNGTQEIVGTCNDSAICIEYSSENSIIVSCTLDNKLYFWDLRKENSNPINSVASESNINSISLSGTNLLATISNSIFLYDLRNLINPIGSKQSSINSSIKCVHSFPNSQGYVFGSKGIVGLKYFDPKLESKFGCAFKCHPKSIPGETHLVCVNDITIHPSCETFVTGDYEGYVLGWSSKSRKKLFEFPKYSQSIASLSYNRDGKYLAIASSSTFQDNNNQKKAPDIYICNMEKFN